VPSASGSRQTCLRHGGVDGETSRGRGRDRLQWDQAGPVARREALDPRDAVGVAGVAAAGDEQDVGLRAPAVVGAEADDLGDVPERADAHVRSPVDDFLAVVVATVRRGTLVDRAIGTDADLDAFPVVAVIAGLADAGNAPQRRRVRIVEPVLEVEVSSPAPRAVDVRFAPGGRVGSAVDYVDERRDRQPGLGAPHIAMLGRIAAGCAATAPEVHRHCTRPLLIEDRGHVRPHQLPNFRPVGGNQRRFVPAMVRHRHRAEDARSDPARQRSSRYPRPGEDKRTERQRNKRHHSHVLDRSLPPLSHLCTRPVSPYLSPAGHRESCAERRLRRVRPARGSESPPRCPPRPAWRRRTASRCSVRRRGRCRCRRSPG